MAKIFANAAESEFVKLMNQFKSGFQTWEIWADFITMFACALSNAVDKEHFEEREKTYLERIGKYSPEEQLLFPKLCAALTMALEENPDQDFLGSLYMKLELGSHWHGQFFTPYHVSRAMAEMDIVAPEAVQKIKDKGYFSVSDCCCGGGAMLIAAINVCREKLEKVNINYQNHVLFFAQDLDGIVAKMCYIQLSLLGVAGIVKIGDSLLDPMCSGESTENYWFTPMFFSEVWSARWFFHSLDRLVPKIPVKKAAEKPALQLSFEDLFE